MLLNEQSAVVKKTYTGSLIFGLCRQKFFYFNSNAACVVEITPEKG